MSRPNRPTMLRAFAAAELSDDGHTVFGRAFPFGEVAHIRETVDGVLDEYDEEFLPGCTARMRQVAQIRGAPNWIKFTLDHERSFDNWIGTCTAMAEDDHGVNVTFELHDDPERIDKIRSILARSHTGLSIEFKDHAAPRIDGNLRQRRQIHISAVTATPVPVYSSARVLAVRADDDVLNAAGTPNLDRVREMLAGIGSSTIEPNPDLVSD